MPGLGSNHAYGYDVACPVCNPDGWRPFAEAEAAAKLAAHVEARTSIGNLPTCEDCGTAHDSDHECPIEMTPTIAGARIGCLTCGGVGFHHAWCNRSPVDQRPAAIR